MDSLKKGNLPSGAEWVLFESRKKAPKKSTGEPILGRHLILQFVDERENASTCDLSEMYLLALKIAKEYWSQSGRFRICQNGPEVATRRHLHIHIIIPNSDEELESIVVRSK